LPVKEALYYKKLNNDFVQCLLCPKLCKIKEGKSGFCGVRENIGNKLFSNIYSRVSSQGMDPIEKKPLYHFYPGSLILSLGTIGCNFACPFCQNWQISQEHNVPTQNMSPSEAVEKALERSSVGIAYTYSEPMIWYEYVMDTAKLAKEKGLKNVLVTNGYINEKPLKELLPFIDAMNIDLKAFDEKFYKEICKGDLGTVLKTIKIASTSCHIEITNLVIPGFNDTTKHFENLVNWIKENIGADIPLHFSRYFPHYKMKTSSATPIETLEQAYEIAKRKLRYVYLGNIVV